jgi:hypothetical protein
MEMHKGGSGKRTIARHFNISRECLENGWAHRCYKWSPSISPAEHIAKLKVMRDRRQGRTGKQKWTGNQRSHVPVSKLTEEEWSDVITLHSNGTSLNTIAVRYGVGLATIKRQLYRRGYSWDGRNPAELYTELKRAAHRRAVRRQKEDPELRQHQKRAIRESTRRRLLNDERYRTIKRLIHSQQQAIYHRDGSSSVVELCSMTGDEIVAWMMRDHPGQTWEEMRRRRYVMHHIYPTSLMDVNINASVKCIMHGRNLQLIPDEINGRIGNRPMRYNVKDATYQRLLGGGRFGKRMTWEQVLESEKK